MKYISDRIKSIIGAFACILILFSVFLPWTNILFTNIYGYNFIGGTFATTESSILMITTIIVASLAFLQNIKIILGGGNFHRYVFVAYGIMILGLLGYFNFYLGLCHAIGPIATTLGATTLLVLGLL